MKFLRLTTTDPYYNLAVEEYLFSHAEEEMLMLWQNAPSVILGKNQSAYAEVDLDYAERHGIRIARRITGGGAVYHDGGNVNYTFISPHPEKETLDFEGFSRPIVEALASLGVPATLSGRNDLEVQGKKISGNAQYHRDGRVLHHGTLLFDTDLDVLEAVLHPDKEKIRSRAIRSVRARVCNLRALLPTVSTVEEFCTLLECFIDTHYAPTHLPTPKNEEIDALAARNASREWLYPKRELFSDYTTARKTRGTFGTLEASMEMSEDTVRTLQITGDFFSLLPITDLETLLRGAKRSEIAARLAEVDVNAYICGMRTEELVNLLCGDATAP